MSKYSLKIDIEEIKIAMINSDQETYLDLRNGQTIIKDPEDLYWGIEENGSTGDEVEDVIDREGWNFLLSIPSKESSEQYKVMEESIETILKDRFQQQLWEAIQGRGAFQRFKDVLLGRPAIRELWFSYQNQWLENEVLTWMKEQDITII
jgi:hypothetical protein